MNHQSVFPAPAASGHRARPLQVAITNFVTVLENDPRLEGAIRLNEMNGRVHIVKPLGWKREKGGAITDTDINYIRLLIEQTYGLVGEKPAVSAIDIVANENRYHPIRELICSFDWDGKERIRYVLHHFLGAEVADLLTCADCGHKLWLHVNTVNKAIRFFACSNYVKDYRGTCLTRHYMKSCTRTTPLGR